MEVIWSDLALQQLDTVVDYVEENFGVITEHQQKPVLGIDVS